MAETPPEPEPPRIADVEAEAPRKAESSLPAYSEPPLRERADRSLGREEVAERDLKGTVFGPGARGLLVALFLLTITVPGVIQLAAELRAGTGLPSFNIVAAMPKWSKVHAAHNPADFWNLAPQADDIKNFEKGMEKGSVIAQWLLPHVQNTLTGYLGAGNEQAYPGRPGWLFYRPDVEYAIGPPFLDPNLLAKRNRSAGVKPDPIPAILDFRDQLQARGIELVIFPVPVKPVIDGERLSGAVKAGEPLQNGSFEEFKKRLATAGVRVFDPTPLLMDRKQDNHGLPLYLDTDTHWRPETMEFVASKLAASLTRGTAGGAAGTNFNVKEQAITSLGDIALMLKLPADQTIFHPQTVTIHQVNVGNAPWRATPTADTLLLGDSFSNIFSLEGMGWGESAGFAEHLSYALGKPIDAILRNSDASFATRDILSKELARGHDLARTLYRQLETPLHETRPAGGIAFLQPQGRRDLHGHGDGRFPLAGAPARQRAVQGPHPHRSSDRPHGGRSGAGRGGR